MSKVDYNPAPPGYNTSGTVGVSGTASGTVYEGPWFIEQQSLNVEYVRVPKASLASTTITLSGTAATFNPWGTVVVAKVNANYNSYQDWQTYFTSSFAQPQKFEIQATSADFAGLVYGDITASTMGPAGTIVTQQEHYRRVPWVGGASGHIQVTKNIEALTYFGVDPQIWTNTSSTVDPQSMINDWKSWVIEPNAAACFLYNGQTFPKHSTYDYYINGTFATAKETLWKILQYIDQIGNRVEHQQLYAIPAYINSISGQIEGNQGFPEYQISRHDYS